MPVELISVDGTRWGSGLVLLHGCPIVPAFSVEKTILSSLNSLGTTVENQLP